MSQQITLDLGGDYFVTSAMILTFLVPEGAECFVSVNEDASSLSCNLLVSTLL
jgi:hypothetical protein